MIGRKLFVLECCPYHSIDFDPKSFGFGGGYVDFWLKLIAWAIKSKKKFIVRSKRIDEFLEMGGLTITSNVRLDFSSCRKVTLSSGNLIGTDLVKEQIRKILIKKA